MFNKINAPDGFVFMDWHNHHSTYFDLHFFGMKGKRPTLQEGMEWWSEVIRREFGEGEFSMLLYLCLLIMGVIFKLKFSRFSDLVICGILSHFGIQYQSNAEPEFFITSLDRDAAPINRTSGV